MATNFRLGLWRLADPKISLASMASLFLGACAAAAEGPLHWGWLALTVLGIFCIEVAKNASGEIFDFDSGTDPSVAPEHLTPFSGGKRVLVEALLTRSQTIGIAAVFYLLGIVIGMVIVGPGTSFPALLASLAAERRKDVGMVLGNVLGSNIFNIFFTLGATALIMPIPLALALNTAVITNVAVTALLVAFVALSKKRTLGRLMGGLLVAIYAGYIYYSLIS